MCKTLLLSTITVFLFAASSAWAIDFASPGAERHANLEFDVGVDLVNHQKFEDATAHLEIALQHFPNDTDILRYLGYAHRMIAREREGTSHDSELRLSNDYYRRALEADPDRKDFLEYMGEMYLEMDDPAAARAKLAELERRCPNGCVERDDLAASIAAYKPVPPVAREEQGALAPSPTH
ncbi:MAG: hypothetical protein WDM89_12855 [Rhizomicrobium sp.]